MTDFDENAGSAPGVQEGGDNLSSESGVVLVIVALAAFLLVLLSIGYSIDFPTTQASVIRTQSALDIGGAHGLQTFYSYTGASNSAFANADAVLRSDYALSSAGLFSAGFANWNRNKHSIWIPSWNSASSSATLADFLPSFQSFRCDSGSAGSCAAFPVSALNSGEDGTADLPEHIRAILARVYDPGSGSARVNDFKNAITFYSHIRPFRYLPILPLSETEVVSTVRLKNTMTTIIVDPAFSMGDENYQRVFGSSSNPKGSTGADDPMMWPYAAFRRVNGNTIQYPLSSNADTASGWSTQTDYDSFDGNLFKKNPVSGLALNASPNDVEKIFKFYTATCDSSPFFLFKTAVVNLIDRLTNSSAFNSTTAVMLTGYGHEPAKRLIPVYPANVESSSIVNFDFSYPLPLNPGGTSEDHNRYLQLKKPAAFTGYMNSRNPNVNTPVTSSGFNRWDLSYCRGLYGSTDLSSSVGSTVGFLLPEDRTNATEGELNHTAANKRRRNTALANNWVDDESVGAIDYEISMTAGQNDAGGESPRNMIGNLAMRVANPKLEVLNQPLATAPDLPPPWIRPTNAATEMGTGWRYLPESLAKACENVGTAVSNYNSSGSAYSANRRIDQEAIVVFSFGLYNDKGLATRNNNPVGDPGTEDQAFGDLATALQSCLCGKPQRKLFIAMLPMDMLDRNQTVRTIDVVKTFSDSKMSRCAAQTPAVDPCAGAGMGSIYTFVYDWEDDRFATLPSGAPTSGVSPGTPASDQALRKLLAAQAFSEEVYDNITRLLIEYEYST